MNSTYEKSAQQERRHPPECPEQERILLRIMMRRMRQIPGKLSRGTRVTFLTCTNDILPTQMRARIRNGQYIMGTVTVIAFRRFRVSKLRHLAMIRIEIRFRNRLMTTTTLLHDLQFETGLVCTPDGVCGVTVIAHRQWLVRLIDKRGVDASFEFRDGSDRRSGEHSSCSHSTMYQPWARHYVECGNWYRSL